MKNENTLQVTNPNQLQLSLTDLGLRIRAREAEIDNKCVAITVHMRSAIGLALEQGDDLLSAKSQLKHGQWSQWLADNFPKSEDTARDYMRLALVPKNERARFFKDAESIRAALKALELFPEVEREQISLPGLPINPAISRLNWLAEWTTKSGDEITAWPVSQRAELKIQLKPIVELWGKL